MRHWKRITETERVLRVVFNPDGDLIVTATWDRGMRRKL